MLRRKLSQVLRRTNPYVSSISPVGGGYSSVPVVQGYATTASAVPPSTTYYTTPTTVQYTQATTTEESVL
jgi:hypothetical protein